MATELTLYLKGHPDTPERVYIDTDKTSDLRVQRFLGALYYADTWEKQKSIIKEFPDAVNITPEECAKVNEYTLFKNGSNVVKTFVNNSGIPDRRTWHKVNETHIDIVQSYMGGFREEDIDTAVSINFQDRFVRICRLNIKQQHIKDMLFPVQMYDFVCVDSDCPFKRTDEPVFKNIVNVKYNFKANKDYIYPVTIIENEGIITMTLIASDDRKTQPQGAIIIKDALLQKWYLNKPSKKQVKAIGWDMAQLIVEKFNQAMRGNIFYANVVHKDDSCQDCIACADTWQDLSKTIMLHIIGVDDVLDSVIREASDDVFNKN